MRVLSLLTLFGALAGVSSLTLGSTFLGTSSPVVHAAPLAVRTRTGAASIQMISHGKRVAKLGKPADQRKALLRALTTEIIRHGRIKTTLVRARAVRPFVDKMISLSKRGDLHARRQVNTAHAEQRSPLLCPPPHFPSTPYH